METGKNTVETTINLFRNELTGIFDLPELEQLLQLTFFHYLGINRVDLTLNKDFKIKDTDFKKINDVIKQLKKNKPLAHIIGEWEFYGMPLTVNEYTLIPRPETEELVELILRENHNKTNLSLLDIGTGSGCIALALKKHLPQCKVTAVDVSKNALSLAKMNANRSDLEVTFYEIDILDWETKRIDEKYNVIVSNPPYIPKREKELMNRNVLDYEPHLALFVEDERPMLFYETIADFALTHLNPSGKIYFEINENYGQAVKSLLQQKSFSNIEIVKDINEKDRMVRATLIN